jgi:hypothetical protein
VLDISSYAPLWISDETAGQHEFANNFVSREENILPDVSSLRNIADNSVSPSAGPCGSRSG